MTKTRLIYIIGLAKGKIMTDNKVLQYIKDVLDNLPEAWLNLTTHRLDIYNESLAKTEFVERLEALFLAQNSSSAALEKLPTAYDYIRLGHPLSSLLEWSVAHLNHLNTDQVISFSSHSMPALAVLRQNLIDGKSTQILYTNELPEFFDADTLKRVYGYQFELKKVASVEAIEAFEGSTIFFDQHSDKPKKDGNFGKFSLPNSIDFYVATYANLGSILLINGEENKGYTSSIQHVRRRETIAMTPQNCFTALRYLINSEAENKSLSDYSANKSVVIDTVKQITHTQSSALVGSSGLSIQYAIMMGLIDHAIEKHPGKEIKIIVPPNCYGGTNDQARRVAASSKQVEILDLPVDGDHNMVQSTDLVLNRVAQIDAVPYIIAEIPTNPRVEVPDLEQLKEALSKKRQTPDGKDAIDPVFILDQTFCPNVNFLGKDQILASVKTISYVSGSKFPSGGKCTAGYCVANEAGEEVLGKIDMHLKLCDNEATALQMQLLAEQLPSMNKRILAAYKNTRELVNHIQATLPDAKINFVSEELADQGFTPSVFSLDLPTKGDTPEAREAFKRKLNHQLIDMMITEIPHESKYCVSYGQLKGCYWTIPATSTQGTTKEDDKDYIARVSVSPDLDLERHKEVFSDFVQSIPLINEEKK